MRPNRVKHKYNYIIEDCTVMTFKLIKWEIFNDVYKYFQLIQNLIYELKNKLGIIISTTMQDIITR